MWSFFKRQQIENQTTVAEQRRRPLAFSEIIAGMGDFSDLANHDAALKFWLPEAVEHALHEMNERSNLSASEFLRQFFAVHCYGLYAFYQMTDRIPGLFKEQSGIKFSIAADEPPKGKKRIDTYWVPELGKNVAPIKVWIPKRMKADLQTLAEHVELTPSNYVREILISRLLGHGMLPQRTTMFKAFPTPAADDWGENREVPWREVSQDEFYSNSISEMRTEWVDSLNE
jgi:hypothetical protein